MKSIFTTVAMMLAGGLIAQDTNDGMGVGTIDPYDYSILDVVSNEKGILIPRLTQTEISSLDILIANDLVEAKRSLLLFNKDSLWFQFYKGPDSNGTDWGWVPLISKDTDANSHAFYDIITNAPPAGMSNNIYTTVKVGVGTNAPTNQLHVVAQTDPLRIENLSQGSSTDSVLTTNAIGVVRKVGPFDRIPPGAVMAFAMDDVPAGWLHCNGSVKNISDYPNLYAAINNDYGDNGAGTFRVPNYRGQFLRGWADGSTTDPDGSNRSDRGDGIDGDNVGTKQEDAFEEHNHTLKTSTGTTTSPEWGVPDNVWSYTNTNCGPQDGYPCASTYSTGGSETRPKNIYVMYCIKF